MSDGRKEKVFWEIIEVLHQSAFLPHIMIIGSWAEYLYPYYLGDDYVPNLKTRDVDIYYGNYFLEVSGAENLVENFRAAGFMLDEHFIDTGKFYKEGLEVEFLSSQMGSGPGMVEIPYTGVKAEKLDDFGMLRRIVVFVRGYEISIPSPVSYVAHKLYINPTRRPESKRPKDIEAVRAILHFLKLIPKEIAAFRALLDRLPPEQRERIVEVAVANELDWLWQK